MFLAVIVLVLPLCAEGTLTEVQKCFTTTTEGIKIGDSQCGNFLEDSICADAFETPINDGLTNAKVDQKCYEDECVSGGCLKRCLLCCQDCDNQVRDKSCAKLKECGGCTRDSLKEIMIKNCPKTCGYCGLRNISSTTTSSTATTHPTSTSTTTESSTSTSTSTSIPSSTILTTSTSRKPSKPCREGWSYCAECHKCYLLSAVFRTIEQSFTHCQLHGALLASPKSQVENDFVAKMFHEGFVYLGTKRKDNPKWIASNGMEQNYFNWNKNHPSGIEKCILLDFPNGLWRSNACNGAAGFTCEVEDRTATNVSNPCDAGWRHCAECHLCYLVVTTVLNVDKGIEYCQQRKSFMSSPKSKIENDFIKGLRGSGYHYLGTKLELNPRWISSGGIEVNYSKWLPSHPVDGNQCILFRFPKGDWESYPCESSTGLVCEMEEGEY